MTTDSVIRRLSEIPNGSGLTSILSQATEITGYPMLIHNMEYRLVASADVVFEDRFWSELVETGGLCEESIAFCRDECFIDEVANNAEYSGIAFLISNKLRHDRVFGQLYNSEGIPVADLIAVARDQQFRDGIVEQLEVVRSKLNAEIGMMQEFVDYGRSYFAGIINDLINGSISDRTLYSAHVANLDRGLGDDIYLFAVHPGSDSPDRQSSLIRARHPDYKYSVCNGLIVILVGIDGKNVAVAFAELVRTLDQLGLHAGISSRFANLYQLNKYFNEAVATMNEAIASGMSAKFSRAGDA